MQNLEKIFADLPSIEATEEEYKKTLVLIAQQIALYVVEQGEKPINDDLPTKVSEAIAAMSYYFHKNPKEVDHDLGTAIYNVNMEELKTAKYLRTINRLH